MPTTYFYSGFTGQKLTKFTNNIARSPQINFLKSELQYCNLFRNARAMNKSE